MATQLHYLDYTIHLTDKAQVTALNEAVARMNSPVNDAAGTLVNYLIFGQAALGYGYLFCSPDRAAAEYSVPILKTGEAFASPCITSPLISNQNANYPTDLDRFEKKVGGWFGISALFGDTIKTLWRGNFVYSPSSTSILDDGNAEPDPEEIAQRRFVDGFELPDNGEGGSTSGIAMLVSRQASRHADGYGLAIRGSDGVKFHLLDENGAALTTSSWERLYIRLIAAPTGNVTFWRCRNSISTESGIQLAISSARRIVINNTDSAGSQTPLGTDADALDLNVWYRVDVLFKYGTDGFFKLHVNRTLKVNVSSLPWNGLGQDSGTHYKSEVGTALNTSDRMLGLDIDDWENMVLPVDLTGLDWKNGTRIVRFNAALFGADHAGWLGEWAAAQQNPSDDGALVLTSTVSGAMLHIKTDAELCIDAEVSSLGAVAILSCIRVERDGVANGELGYSIAGLAPVMTALVQALNPTWYRVAHRPAGMIQPASVTPIDLYHEKGAAVDPSVVYNFSGIAALLGVWGPEDVVKLTGAATAPKVIAGNTGVHNSPYPRTAWARKGPPPLSPVVVVGGTYIGNGTLTELLFLAPVNWLWIRRLGTPEQGVRWYSSMLAAHEGFQQVTSPEGMVQAGINETFAGASVEDEQEQQTILRVVGDQASSNAVGVTYQYIAFCDPGMRFTLNAGLSYHRGAADRTTILVNDNFLPEAMFLNQEVTSGTADVAAFYKGIGHGTTEISKLDTTVTPAAISFARGSLLSKAAIQFAGQGQSIPVSLWRRDDGSNDPGIPRVMALATYTGDGAGNRTVALAPVSGRYPLFGLVVPHTTMESHYRDPSHTGTTSTKVPGSTVAANGIRGGGMDQIMVGSDLNANGIVYDVFVIPGSDEAGNNGWGTNGEFIPVEPAIPLDGPWDFPTTGFPGFPGFPGDPDGGDGEEPETPDPIDFETGCLAHSIKLANQALALLGISKQIVTLATDQAEDIQVNLHFQTTIDEVLRDFPWAFATKYRTLTLVAGTTLLPATSDWVYAYRAPSDMLFARRLVNTIGLRGRRDDDDPPKFRVGRDTTGALIYANVEGAYLEYTYRVPCAAEAGDSLFREAVKWKLAAVMAMPLGRDEKQQVRCLQVYDAVITRARGVNAREQQQETDRNDAPWITGR